MTALPEREAESGIATRPGRGRNQALGGLRGFDVPLVAASHATIPTFRFGDAAGLTLFFGSITYGQYLEHGCSAVLPETGSVRVGYAGCSRG